MEEIIKTALGLDLPGSQLSTGQMALRAAVIYISAVLMVRIGGSRRFIGSYAPIDVVLSIIFGSTMSRAINGSSAFFPSLAAGLVLVLIHRIIAFIAYYSSGFERIIKGRSRILIQDGSLCHQQLQRSQITVKDLEGALRTQTQLDRLDQVQQARLESNGQISFSAKSNPSS